MGHFDKSPTRRWALLDARAQVRSRGWRRARLSYTAVMFDEIGRCDNAGVAMGITVHTDMATPSLHQFGSDDLKRPRTGDQGRAGVRHRRHRARRFPNASIKTRAVRDGDDWVINGRSLHHERGDRRLALPARRDRSVGRLRRVLADHRRRRPGVSYQLLDKIGNLGSTRASSSSRTSGPARTRSATSAAASSR